MSATLSREADSAPRDGASPLRIGTLRLPQLQYLRGLAAASVVAFHLSGLIAGPLGTGTAAQLGRLVPVLGVPLFFAISGFLMAVLAERTSPALFLVHRVIRIYPAYWLAVAAAVALNGVRFGLNTVPDFWTLALVPGPGRHYVLGVEWSLPFELTFYVVVWLAMVMGLGRRMHLVGAAWLLLIAAVSLLAPAWQRDGTGGGAAAALPFILVSEYTVPFAAGLLIPFADRRGLITPACGLLAAGLIAVGAALAVWQPWLTGAGAALLVGYAVHPGRDSKAPSGALVRLGDWSYALYLCHRPAVDAVLAILQAEPAKLATAAAGCALLAAGALGTVELRCYAALKRIADRLPAWSLQAFGGAVVAVLLGGGLFTAVRENPYRAARAEAAPAIARIQAETPRDLAALARAARSAELAKSTTLQGEAETVQAVPGGLLVVSGWAVDRARPGSVTVVSVFYGGALVGQTTTEHTRKDVASRLSLPRAGAHYGFATVLPSFQCRPGTPLLLLFVDHGRFAADTVAADRVPCPGP